jgi:hypothetical protein
LYKYNPYRDNSFSTAYEALNIDWIRSLFTIYMLPVIEVNIKRSELNILAKQDGIAFVAFCK